MTIAIARNGVEAMMAFRRGDIDLIILDVGMPEMDGLEVCRQIRRTSGLPILFLSARDEEIDRIIGLEIGGDDYVAKPFQPARTGGAGESNPEARGYRRAKRPRTGSIVWSRYGLIAMVSVVTIHRQRGRAHRTGIFNPRRAAAGATGHGVFSTRAVDDDRLSAPRIYVADRTIDSHIRNIRAKFATAGCDGVVATVHGVGFRFNASLFTPHPQRARLMKRR